MCVVVFKVIQIYVISQILRKWGKLIMKTPMKILILFLALALLGIGIYGTTNITQKFQWKKLAPDGSYFRKFANARDEEFPAGYDVSVILPTNINFASTAIQDKIIALDQIAKSNTRYDDLNINWMTAYRQWENKTINLSSNFYTNLKQFISKSPVHNIDVTVNNDNTSITAARVIFFYQNNSDAINQADAMKTMRTDLKTKSTLDVYPISIMFTYAEQFAAVLDATIQNLAICAGAIALITLPYLMHPGIVMVIVLSFASLLCELLGLMAAWDVSLDAIAMIIIIMSIGFSVDYTCHIAHSYMISTKKTAEERIIDALETMGTSVMNGGTI